MAYLLKPKPPSSLSLLSFRLSSSSHCTFFKPFSNSLPQSSAATLLPSDAKLLDNLHSLIKDHHITNPNPNPIPSPLPPDLTFPSLSTSFSHLSPIPLPSSLTLLLIRRCSSLRHGIPFPQTLSLFNWWLSSSSPSPSLSPDPFVDMIDLSAKLQHFHISWHLLDTMHSLQIPIPHRAFAALIRRYARAGLPSDAVDAFNRMSEFGCEPTASSFSLIISALSKKRFGKEAQSLFDSLKDKFPPDVVVYSALIHAWCRAGRIDEAERVFLEMKAHGVVPNVYTYTAVIDAMCRAGQIPRAQEVLCQMIVGGCPPNAATFNSLMRAHVKAGRTEQVLQVHNQMKQLSVEPDVITYNFLIDAHCQKGQKNLDAAHKVLNLMASNGCSPNAHSFNPMFKCILDLGDVNAAHRLYTRMRELECRPNTVTYNLLMQLFSKEKSMDMVIRMKKEMDEEGVEPNVNTYGVLISAFCGRGHWKRAYQLLKEMVEEKCLKPTVPVYEMVLGLLRRAGQLKKHGELVEKMAERGFIVRSL